MQALSALHTRPCQVEIHRVDLPPIEDDQVLIKSRFSALSPGTESMLFQGRMPKGYKQDTTIKSLGGDFSYPFAYGYALVGTVIETGPKVSPDWCGREVFAFHPHQNYALASIDDCLLVPNGISPLDALFLANMESALNFVMDAHPNVGETAMVFGQGIVGLLTSSVLAKFPLGQLITADPLASRRQRSIGIGAQLSIDPTAEEEWRALKKHLFEHDQAISGLDIAFELSGQLKALNQAIELIGFSGKILVGSWYGENTEPLNLSCDFHRRRIQLISSQVSSLNPLLSGRWDKTRRISLAWDWIKKLEPKRFITHGFPLEQSQDAFELVSEIEDDVLQVIFQYHNYSAHP